MRLLKNLKCMYCMYVCIGEDGDGQDPGLFDSCDRPADPGEDQGVSDEEGLGQRRCFPDCVCMYVVLYCIVCLTWVGDLTESGRPAVVVVPRILILSPTRELAQQIAVEVCMYVCMYV